MLWKYTVFNHAKPIIHTKRKHHCASPKLTQLVTPAGNAAVHPVRLVSIDTKAPVGRDALVPRWLLAQRVKTLCQLLRPRSWRVGGFFPHGEMMEKTCFEHGEQSFSE